MASGACWFFGAEGKCGNARDCRPLPRILVDHPPPFRPEFQVSRTRDKIAKYFSVLLYRSHPITYETSLNAHGFEMVGAVLFSA